MTTSALSARTGRAPLYLRVADSLSGEIEEGRIAADERLPSERELCRRFGVSRVTVRQALTHLEADGLVVSAAGRGWFATRPRLAEPAGKVGSFTRMAESVGLTVTSRILEQEVREATLDEAEQLRTVAGAALFSLYRLRFVDGLPIALDHSRVPLAVAPGLADQDFTRQSLQAALVAAGAGRVRTDCVVTAQLADRSQARLLKVPPGSALLAQTQTSFDVDGRPVELGAISYRGDRYRFRAVLTSSAEMESHGPW